MSELLINLMQVLIFLASLAMLSFFGKVYFRSFLGKWRIMVWGFAILSLTSIFQFASNFKFFHSIGISSFAKDYLTATLVFGYCLGGLLLVGSLSSWFSSLYGSQEVALNRLKQLICFKSLLSVANHSRDLEMVLKESLANLMLIMGYKKGVIFKSPLKSWEMELVAHWGFKIEKIHRLHNLKDTNPFFLEVKKSKEVVVIDEIKKLPEYDSLFSIEDDIRSFICVPIKYRNKVCGVMGIYDSKKKVFTYQKMQFLSNWGNMLGAVIEEITSLKRNKLRRNYLSASEDICKLLKGNDFSLENVFPAISKILQKVIDFNYLCLSLLDKSGENMRRFTMGSGGNLLLDKGMSLPTRGTPVKYVVQNKEALLDDEIRGNDKFVEDDLLKAMEICSRLIIPLKIDKKVYATLTFGHIKYGYYNLLDVKWLNLIADLLVIFIIKIQGISELNKTEKRSMYLKNIARGVIENKNIEEVFGDVASEVTKELPTTFCRIVLLDQEKKKLNTKALFGIRDRGINFNSQMEYSLSDLPWHRLALKSNRLMLINQDDPESLMPQDECRAIMTDRTRSALLVPLIVNGKSLGIISLGEERNWQRRPFTLEDMEFMERIALQLSIAIRDSYLSELNWVPRKKLDRAEKIIGRFGEGGGFDNLILDLNYSLNDTLTIIIGSAELLYLKAGHLSPEINKYAKSIERNANRIHKTIKEFADSKS